METRTLDIPVALPEYYEDCERCIERLMEAMLRIDGMKSVTLDESTSSLVVTYDPSFTSMERVAEQARQIGVEITHDYIHESLTLEGLDCPDCALKMERALSKLRGVIWASVNYATSILNIEYVAALASHDDIVRRVREIGYDVVEPQPLPRRAAPRVSFFANRRAVLTTISGLFLAVGYVLSLLGASERVYDAFYAVALVTGGYYPARSALYSARALSLDTNVLMTVAATGAVALGDWFEAAMVLFLFSLGGALEAYTVDKTRRSIRSLVETFPSEALVQRDGGEYFVPVEKIQVGDIVIVKPGDRIAVDGKVIGGGSSVDQSAITGESIPAEKAVGDSVFAGSINQRGSLEIRVSSSAEDNTLAKIIHLVEEAQAQKAPSQRFSERFGRIYTPIVISMALILVIAPPFFGGDFSEWFRRALILLVVSCPCALVISTPVAIVAAIGSAAKNGVLVKGGAYLEEMAKVSVVAFDKTGTLTTGRLRVTDIVPMNHYAEDEILQIAATIESRSEHPLADAILTLANERGVPLGDVTFFEALPGKGARAVVDGQVYYIGNQRLMNDLKLEIPENELAERVGDVGGTLMFVGVEDTLIGVIAAADSVKDTSADAIRRLRLAGVRKTVMLTGDSHRTAEAVATGLGIDETRAELLPEEKVAAIRELMAEHGRVAMVGDGINDAPALAAATIGVAMGGAGSHAVLETADITLMADDLSRLPYSIKLSRNSLRIIKQNIGFSALVALSLVTTSLIGWLTLAGGVIGHELSALIVIANGMRLLRTRD